MGKKIGVVTFCHSVDNYGQILQCFALQEYLRECGHQPYLIRYSPKMSFAERLSVSKIFRMFSIKGVRKLISIFSQSRKLSVYDVRNFGDFINQYISKDDIIYTSITELKNDPPKADVYICGSDQIWGHPLLEKHTAGWFLDFGDSTIRRVSYAASMGHSNLNTEEKKYFSSYLSRFDAIGVREVSLQTDCADVGFDKAKVVLDPTLLLPCKKYKDIFRDMLCDSSAPFLFMYIINVETPEEIYWSDINQFITDQNLALKVVYSSGYLPAKDILPNTMGIQASIPQWLSYIYSSECVVTTSFHGVAFCIKMNKPFLSILLTNKHSSGNDRIIGLLEKLGLSDRVYNPELLFTTQMSKEINWDNVNKKMVELTIDSISFVNNNI